MSWVLGDVGLLLSPGIWINWGICPLQVQSCMGIAQSLHSNGGQCKCGDRQMACAPSDSSQLHFPAVYYRYKHLDVFFKAELHHWGPWLTGHSEGTSLSACYCISDFILVNSHRILMIGSLKSKKIKWKSEREPVKSLIGRLYQLDFVCSHSSGFPNHPSVHVDPGSESPEERGLWGILEKSLVLNLFIWTNYFNYSN